MSGLNLISQRPDDGGARYSVKALISELESNMRGGNKMNITGMNLGIVRTLLNHINVLEDRLHTMEVTTFALEHRLAQLEGERQVSRKRKSPQTEGDL